MIIKKTRISSINANIGHINPGTKFIVGIKDIERHTDILNNIGFTDNLDVGESVLPTPLGSVSKFNAIGKDLIHKDQPKETAYTTIIWEWEQWAGHGRTERKSKLVDRPYERYPRTFISPPSLEFTISTTTDGNKVIITPIFEYNDNDDDLIHRINLFLEIFGECQLFTENLDDMIKSPIKRLNWELLPKGNIPWERLYKIIEPIVKKTPKSMHPIIWDRIQIIDQYKPDFHAIGKAGFKGYVVFGFEDINLYILESIYYGNATYVFEENWEELSKKTKAEILDKSLQKSRIIHRSNWESKLVGLLSN
jgi:hypothetical protein